MNILDIAIAKRLAGGGGESGTDNYNDLSNLPKINDVTLSGNKSSSALGLQSEINSDSKLASDLVDDTNQDNKFVTSTEKNTWNTKQNAIDSDHKLSSDLVDDANKTNKFVTSTEKNTWNAKQNAIDADHKLSSSLVSFSTAEAAAIASGIDSSKVGQISTNQTNILYTANRTGKNVLITQRAYEVGYSDTIKGITYTVQDDYSVKVNGTCTASTGDYSTFVIISSALHADNNYGHEISGFILNGCPNLNGDLWIAIERRDSPYTNYGYDDGSNASGVTINTIPTGVNVLIFIRVPSGKTINNAVVYPMIRPAFTDSTYQPPSLPNYDLTRLESEDRAGLVECVDGGAKNKFDINGVYNADATLTISGNTITMTTDDTRTYLKIWAKIYNSSGTEIAYPIEPTDITANGVYNFPFTKTSNASYMRFGHNGATKDGKLSYKIDGLANGDYILQIKVINCTTASGHLSWGDIMICTKAAFGVSPKFVPYRYDPYTTTWQNISNSTTLYARRCGHVVTVNGYMDNISFTANTAVTIGTIDSSIGIPPNQVRAVCNVGSNAYSVGKQGYVTISSTDGQIKVTSEYSGTGAVYFSLSYII